MALTDAASIVAALPDHACGLYLEHNRYRDFYDTITMAVAAEDAEHNDWVSPEERAQVLATG